MDPKTRSEFQLQIKQVRADLKKWENEWAQSHAGAKPGRDDIKENAEIARKYKQYNKLRDVLSGKIPPPSGSTTTSPTSASRPKKRKSSGPPTTGSDAAAGLVATTTTITTTATTPSKRRRPSVTPCKTPSNLSSDPLLAALSPCIARTLFSPPAVSSLGPTPQRDGHVLGLFDLLAPPSPGGGGGGDGEDTPLRAKDGQIVVKSLFATPRKKAVSKGAGAETKAGNGGSDEEEGEETPNRRQRGRTPMSSSRRQLLNIFMTPLKKVDDADNQNNTRGTPSSLSRLQFDTPAFLRRAPLASQAPPAATTMTTTTTTAKTGNGECGAFDDLAPLRLPRKPLVRGLSAIVASLRKVEEEVLDEELEALRDMEADEMGSRTMNARPRPPKPAKTVNGEKEGNEAAGEEKENSTAGPVMHHAKDSNVPDVNAEILAPDMVPRLLSGFDDEALYDSSPDEQVGRDGLPQRTYKKKGQKRTTRRSNMKPVRARRPTAPMGEQTAESLEGEESVAGYEGNTVGQGDQEDQGDQRDIGEEGRDGSYEDEYYEGSDAQSGDSSDDEGGKANGRQRAKSQANSGKSKEKAKNKAKAKGKAKEKMKEKAREEVERRAKDAETETEHPKKKQRKVNGNALAHTNFRRLKLKNHGAKGGPGYGSRFRRRR